ncbi:hypothetical protein [Consotaella salsifontis]|uniref:Uncharacterized protein n=1 Tax=Consotaella salsifontis TaxID=1365950 RepID=A0A1T4N5F4_9HYPH|nr:hypothetical protein [Consotaella salsifontis]SJZ74463.1 hypothetical protein SAMN05428963_102422 [Consotaella salsifontis]
MHRLQRILADLGDKLANPKLYTRDPGKAGEYAHRKSEAARSFRSRGKMAASEEYEAAMAR